MTNQQDESLQLSDQSKALNFSITANCLIIVHKTNTHTHTIRRARAFQPDSVVSPSLSFIQLQVARSLARLVLPFTTSSRTVRSGLPPTSCRPGRDRPRSTQEEPRRTQAARRSRKRGGTQRAAPSQSVRVSTALSGLRLYRGSTPGTLTDWISSFCRWGGCCWAPANQRARSRSGRGRGCSAELQWSASSLILYPKSIRNKTQIHLNNWSIINIDLSASSIMFYGHMMSSSKQICMFVLSMSCQSQDNLWVFQPSTMSAGWHQSLWEQKHLMTNVNPVFTLIPELTSWAAVTGLHQCLYLCWRKLLLLLLLVQLSRDTAAPPVTCLDVGSPVLWGPRDNVQVVQAPCLQQIHRARA